MEEDVKNSVSSVTDSIRQYQACTIVMPHATAEAERIIRENLRVKVNEVVAMWTAVMVRLTIPSMRYAVPPSLCKVGA
jgi:hypothetical protein